MQIVKYAPTILFIAFAIQTMILRQFTYQSGFICLILGLVAFGFSFFDTRNDLKDLKAELEEYKKENSVNIINLEERIHEASSVLNAVKMQNKVTTRRM